MLSNWYLQLLSHEATSLIFGHHGFIPCIANSLKEDTEHSTMPSVILRIKALPPSGCSEASLSKWSSNKSIQQEFESQGLWGWV